MKELENKILLTGFVAKNTLKVNSYEHYVLIRFGLRLSTSSRNRETQEWERSYATQFCYGHFPYDKAENVVALLKEDKAIVTVECRLQARNYRDASGVQRESLELYLLSVSKAEELPALDTPYDMAGMTDNVEVTEEMVDVVIPGGKKKTRRTRKVA